MPFKSRLSESEGKVVTPTARLAIENALEASDLQEAKMIIRTAVFDLRKTVDLPGREATDAAMDMQDLLLVEKSL